MGGKNDKSFNEAAYNGAEAYKDETGNDYREFEIQNDAQVSWAPLRTTGSSTAPERMAGKTASRNSPGPAKGRISMPAVPIIDPAARREEA